MKIAFAVLLGLVLIFVGVQVFSFVRQKQELNATLTDMQNRLAQEKSQEADLQSQTQYLENPTNLEKELRSQFNYKKPGETMIIIVPGQTSTPSHP